MAPRSEPRTPSPWAAFLAGALVMLLVVLIWFAWSRTDQAMKIIGRVTPNSASFPRFPRTPPPEGPHVPQIPIPKPQ